ncbi:PilN domain-containing protein [Acetobacter sp. TBRC 12305]|uniref:PilN domain-containing protein n=1 Tax=Acetobacter garciniae TaxID=2817435 RepID=A0A939HNT2_9PROT|nr:PilN domain-containing protein [Acetobacter garciniae]MBO1325128.1 PilN domain-containing protein [Acetobacter garciniae]MBX0344901.1 PilN domain-containing protein [Acetobacter garciniae]
MIVSAFLDWWWRQMRGLVPRRLRLVRFSSRPVLVALWDGATLTLCVEGPGGRVTLGTLATSAPPDDTLRAACDAVLKARPAPAAIVLRLGAGRIIRRAVSLPAATEADLGGALAFEMDRLTPFAADAVVYRYDIVRRDPELNQIQLVLSVVPRAFIEPALHMLATLGVRPAWVEDTGGAGRIALGAGRAGRWGRGPGVLRGAALAGVLCLPVLAVAALFSHQSAQQARLAARIAALQPALHQAMLLRRTVEDRQAGATVIARARQQWGDPMAVLAATTQVLPDNSFLTDLVLRQGQLIMIGQSPEPTALIQALSTNTLFHDPAFAAPVTRAQGQGASAFSIRVDVGTKGGGP